MIKTSSRLASVQIHGARELDRALKLLPARVAVNHIRSAARAALVPVRKIARDNLAVFGKRSGRLHKAQALKINTKIDRSAKVVVATLTNSKNTFYGRFLEFGTKYIPGRRWLTTAAEKGKDDALRAFKEQAWKRITNDAKGMRKRG